MFALNEELDEIREERESGAPEQTWKARLDRAREPIERKRAEHEAALEQLSAEWDALVDASAGEPERRRVLDELQERFLERNYITNLLAGIERELSSERHYHGGHGHEQEFHGLLLIEIRGSPFVSVSSVVEL